MITRHVSNHNLTAYADGAATETVQRRVVGHLSHCAACAEALHHLQEVTHRAAAMPVLLPPADLRQRIAAKLAIEPIRSLRCREAMRLLQEALDHALSPFAAGALQLHVDECADCRAAYAELARTTEAVRSLSPVPVPARVRQTVYATSRQPVRVSWGRRLRPAYAAAAMVASGALFFFLQSGSQVAPPVTVSQPSSAVTQANLTKIIPPPVPVNQEPTASSVTVARMPVSIGRTFIPVERVQRARTIPVPVGRVTTAAFNPTTIPPEPHPLTAPGITPEREKERAAETPANSLSERLFVKSTSTITRYMTAKVEPGSNTFKDLGDEQAVIETELRAGFPQAVPGRDSSSPGGRHESGTNKSGTIDWAEASNRVKGTV